MYPVMIHHSPPGMEAHRMHFHGWFHDADSLVYLIPCLTHRESHLTYYLLTLKKKHAPRELRECVLIHVRLFATPWTVPHQAPPSMGCSRQQYWSGLPFPSPGDLPNAGIELASLVSPTLTGGFFTTSATLET